MVYIVGVDQGSTKTAAVVGDEKGNILGVGISGGACYASEGMEFAMARVRESVYRALEQAELEIGSVSVVSAGLTGADWPYEYELLKDAVISTLDIPNVLMANDCVIALRGGTNRTYGAVICAGSGLNAAVRSPEGKEFVYGYYIQSNDGGGSSLGKLAMDAVFAAECGIGSVTSLTDSILEHFKVPNANDLLMNISSRRLAVDYKKLAPVLFKAADEEDEVAMGILERFGGSIARYVIAGFRRFNMLESDADVVLSGSIFKAKTPILKESVVSAIHREAPNARIVDAVYEPVVGAYLIGLDNIYKEMLGEKIINNISVSAEKLNLIRVMD